MQPSPRQQRKPERCCAREGLDAQEAPSGVTMSAMPMTLPHDLTRRIEAAGYYPELVCDTVAVAIADEQVVAHLVHAETTFDTESVRRHLSVLAITATRLVFVHADDHGPELFADGDGEAFAEQPAVAHAVATSEAIPLRSVGPVMITHVIADPARYRSGSLGREITLTIAWGAVSRVDLEPATCGDPHCEADHGLTGSITGDDLSLRISADADGPGALSDALAFARELSAATARA